VNRTYWYLALSLEDRAISNNQIPTWQENQIAFFSPESGNLSDFLQFSSDRDFVIMGEAWLSNRAQLISLLNSQLNQDRASSSDLELIALVWTHWQLETFSKLEGIFCLAVWDRMGKVLYLARDRVGAKTLYYTSIEDSICWVAPSLRALNPYHDRRLNLVALRDYLCCAFVPGSQTLWQNVKELRPAEIISFPNGEAQTYWQLEELEESISENSLAWHGGNLRSLLEQVVKDALPDNQPVGIFLSGGLDSSAVTALAAKFHSNLHTYSIHFGKDCANELEFSSLVANHCGTNHHILEISFNQLWEKLPETMAYLDDPIGDPLTVPNLLLGQLAKKSVAIVLNGEGGDPCFGGPKNQPMLLNQLYGATQSNPLQAYLLAFQKCAADLSQLIKPEWREVRNQPYVFEADLASPGSYLNRLMALNIKYKGADQILTKVSNLTTAAGLEGRSPLFDQRIVAMSMQIPPEYKLSGVIEKAVLKQAVRDLLPDRIVDRPKSGMMVPVQLGFHKHWNRAARQLLLSPKAAIAPYLNQALIRDWLDYRGDTWKRYGVKLWLLVSLEIWLQVNKK
jgi:asparagine synthase (glutamine-hydrolysing)